MKIEKANKTDAKKLTDLTIRSKNFWNYGDQQIAEWSDKLTIGSKYIEDHHVFKLTLKNEVIGFYAFQAKINLVKLDFLFVEPKYIGAGFGKKLMTDFLQRIEKTNYEKIILDADPNAEGFYTNFGFEAVGKLKSSIKDRFLPIMELEINAKCKITKKK